MKILKPCDHCGNGEYTHWEETDIVWCRSCCEFDFDLLIKAGIHDIPIFHEYSICELWQEPRNVDIIKNIPKLFQKNIIIDLPTPQQEPEVIEVIPAHYYGYPCACVKCYHKHYK